MLGIAKFRNMVWLVLSNCFFLVPAQRAFYGRRRPDICVLLFGTFLASTVHFSFNYFTFYIVLNFVFNLQFHHLAHDFSICIVFPAKTWLFFDHFCACFSIFYAQLYLASPITPTPMKNLCLIVIGMLFLAIGVHNNPGHWANFVLPLVAGSYNMYLCMVIFLIKKKMTC